MLDNHSFSPSKALGPAILSAQSQFRDILARHVVAKGVSPEQYARYLTMQYHLTKDVQGYFLIAAAHHDLAKRRSLRRFLFDFANEEELHYLVAGNDLAKLDQPVGAIPFDVVLWHSYFKPLVHEKPFIRLGAACILENISGGVAKSEVERALRAPFLTRDNSKFIVLHQHEVLPHGAQILEALDDANLSQAQIDDLIFGANVGTVMYLRMAEWALDPSSLAAQADRNIALSKSEDLEIDALDGMDLLTASGSQ